jgi:hypothetical protein
MRDFMVDRSLFSNSTRYEESYGNKMSSLGGSRWKWECKCLMLLIGGGGGGAWQVTVSQNVLCCHTDKKRVVAWV